MPNAIFSEEEDFGIYAGISSTLWKQCPGARYWRNNLSTKAQKAGAGIEIIEEAAQQLLDAGL